MYKTLHNFCPIGQDLYTSELEITFEPTETIPDYIELEAELDKLEGQELVIEDVVYHVTKILKEYDPFYIDVTATVEDAKHLKVKVNKSFYVTTK